MKNETNPNPKNDGEPTEFEKWFQKMGDKLKKSIPDGALFMLVAVRPDAKDGCEAATCGNGCPHDAVGLIEVAEDANKARLAAVGEDCTLSEGGKHDPARN